MVFVGFKNLVYVGKNVFVYSLVKVFEIYLVRCIVVEGGEFGIWVNFVLFDVVF